MLCPCLLFIRSCQNHLARHSERGKKTRQTEQEVGRQHQGMDRPGVRQVPEGGGEQGKMEKIACTITCGAPTTLAVMGQTIMMIIFPWEYVAEDIAFLLPQDLSCSCEFVSGYFDTSQPLGIVSECRVPMTDFGCFCLFVVVVFHLKNRTLSRPP